MMAFPGATMEKLRTLEQPTLLVHGDRDLLVPVSSARRMSADHPGWRVEIAPDTGHVPMLEAPGWTTVMIEDWLTHEGSAAAVRSSTAPYVGADPVS
jgi:pimeloyl-ACP methyl ester carboxylesterase